MPFANPQLAARAAESRHRRALRAGYIVLKIQRPLATNGAPDWLFYNEDRSIYTLLPPSPDVVALLGAELKVYVYAKLIPAPTGEGQFFELVSGSRPPEQDW